MLTMKSMEYDDEDQLDFASPISMPEKPRFPPNLRFCLTEKELSKFKLDAEGVEVGEMFHFAGMARITSVTQDETDNGKTCRIECQMEDLGLESEDAENE